MTATPHGNVSAHEHNHPMRRQRLVFVLFALIMILGTSLMFMLLLRLQQASRTLTLSAERPLWTASISGSTGDTAEIWIWTATATLKTNLPIPVSLKLDRKSLLIAVRSRGNRDLAFDVGLRSSGSAHLRLTAGQTNTAVFVSRNWIPGMPVDFFMGTTFPAGAPMEVMPVYGPFWRRHTVGFEEVAPASGGSPRTPSP